MRWEEMNTQVAPPSWSVNLSTSKNCAPRSKDGRVDSGRKGGREEGKMGGTGGRGLSHLTVYFGTETGRWLPGLAGN